MFWKRKPKSPITEAAENWIMASVEWFEKTFDQDLAVQEIYLPTEKLLGFQYGGTSDDALKIIDLVAEKLKIDRNLIEAYFFEDFQPMEFSDEGTYASFEEGAQLINGLYTKADGVYQIGIEKSLLHNPLHLIATIAHELTHVKLLGEDRLEVNDEPLTDLSASLFGFVIFLANCSISKMTAWSGNTHTGWKISGSAGYLHHKVYAFLIACWMIRKKEVNPDWLKYLDREILSEVKKATGYLTSKNIDQHA